MNQNDIKCMNVMLSKHVGSNALNMIWKLNCEQLNKYI
jgi:hypothetical protein